MNGWPMFHWHISRKFLIAAALIALAYGVAPRCKLHGLLASWWRFAQERPLLVWLVVWCIAAFRMVNLTRYVYGHAVDVPLLDDWEMARLIVKQHLGQLTFADIFAQQQEGRTVLPKLIFIASAWRGVWDVRGQIMISVASCWLGSAGIFFLLKRTCSSAVAVAVAFLMAVTMIFSPAQFELWLFASGFPSFLPALFIIAALVAIELRWSIGIVFVVCAVLATASSFTLPQGLLAWGLTFPVLLLARPPARWKLWTLLWAIACAACAAAYFHGYVKPAYLPTFAPAVSVGDYVGFFVTFLGGALAYTSTRHAATAALCYGSVQLLLLGALGVYLLWRREVGATRANAVPWLALCGYSIGSAVLAAFGRVGYGADYALASRYVTYSLYLGVGLVGLLATVLPQLERFSIRSRALAVGLLLLGFLVPYRFCATNTSYFMRAYAANARLARGALLFSQVLDTTPVLKRLVYPPDANVPVKLAADLDRLKLLRTPLLRTRNVTELPRADSSLASRAGAFERLDRVEENTVKAHGWAAIPGKHRRAACIVLAQETAANQPVAFAISDVLEPRVDVVQRTKNTENYWGGWSATFDARQLPAGATITAWAFDTSAPKLFRLAGEQRLNTP